MAALPTIAQTIDYADLSVGLCANNNAKGSLFGRRVASPSSPVTMAIVTDALRWANDGGAVAAADLRAMANYLWWLINPYGLTAKNLISGGGGGSVVPSAAARPVPLDFEVSASSVIATGASGLTITSYIGWNLQFDRGGITQNTTNLGDGSSYYTWDRDTGTFSCSPAAAASELFRLTPV